MSSSAKIEHRDNPTSGRTEDDRTVVRAFRPRAPLITCENPISLILDAFTYREGLKNRHSSEYYRKWVNHGVARSS